MGGETKVNAHRGRRALRAIAVVGGLSVLAAACEIVNPGPYVLTLVDGSTMTMRDGSGVETFSYGMDPECDDGIDNDVDDSVDLADSGCVASDDASERHAGLQPYVAPTVPIDVHSDGTFTVKQNQIRLPEAEIHGIQITPMGVGSDVTSYYEADGSHVVDLRFKVELVGVAGAFEDLPLCVIGPMTGHFVLESYDPNTGKAVLTSQGTPLKAIEPSECEAPYNDLLNTGLGLPGTTDATIIGIVANDAGEHPAVG